jgi:hypothetical protein
MGKDIKGGYQPRAHLVHGDGFEQRGYKPLTEGYKPQDGKPAPATIPPLPSGVQMPQPTNSNPQPSPRPSGKPANG